MGANLERYEVVSECYVPVGRSFRYKRAGQVVTLSDVDADSIADHIKPVGVAKRNTPEVVGEVTSDAGDPNTGDERADTEAD